MPATEEADYVVSRYFFLKQLVSTALTGKELPSCLSQARWAHTGLTKEVAFSLWVRGLPTCAPL